MEPQPRLVTFTCHHCQLPCTESSGGSTEALLSVQARREYQRELIFCGCCELLHLHRQCNHIEMDRELDQLRRQLRQQ